MNLRALLVDAIFGLVLVGQGCDTYSEKVIFDRMVNERRMVYYSISRGFFSKGYRLERYSEDGGYFQRFYDHDGSGIIGDHPKDTYSILIDSLWIYGGRDFNDVDSLSALRVHELEIKTRQRLKKASREYGEYLQMMNRIVII